MSVLGRVADHAYVGAVVRAECGGLFSLVWNKSGVNRNLGRPDVAKWYYWNQRGDLKTSQT